MDIKVSKTATITLSKEEVMKLVQENIQTLIGEDSELKDYDVIGIEDLQKTHSEPGLDPHDAYYYNVFDGIQVKLQNKWQN